MREEKEPITFLEEGFDSMSRYSKDGKFAYSIPEDGMCYGLRNGCVTLELKGRESTIFELVLPTTFHSFHVDSIYCLPYLRKITAYSEFDFVSGDNYYSYVSDVAKYWRGTRLEEISVLPWLVDKYKKIFGYWPGLSEAIINVTPIPDDIAFKLVKQHSGGYITSKNGKTIVKVDNNIKVLEIPTEIERVAATAFDENNIIEKVVILGDCEDYHKNRNSIDFDKDAINSLIHTKTLVFQGPMYTHFYDDVIEGAKMPNLKTVIYPLWNYNHYCFRGSEAEGGSMKSYEIKAENYSSVELIEEDGIVYTKDGKFLVSGIDCKAKSIRIKDGVEEIFQYAFCCNLSIEEVYIPRSVTKVGECAFKSCKNIKKIVFNFNQITKDTEYAFFTYSREIHFYLPYTDFSNIVKYQYEKLHNNFRRQGLGALTGKTTNDNAVVVHTLPYFSGDVTIDEETGFVYNEKGDTFVGIITDKAKDIRTITLPSHIRSVTKNAFDANFLKSVEEIVAPEGIPVKVLYDYAKSCQTLKTIVAGKNKINVEDGIAYYNGCKEIFHVPKSTIIHNLVCKEGTETIASSAFEGHKELVKIHFPQSIKNISDRAFANTGISEIVFPESLNRIGQEAFASCNLSAVVYEGKIADGSEAFDKANFVSSAYIKVHKIYKESFIRKYPKLKGLVKTPMPKWLSWLE